MHSHRELDLTLQAAVLVFFSAERPDYVFLAAARVGGIHANDTYLAEFIRDNLLIQINILDAAYKSGVQKLLFLGSSYIYPKYAPQPMKEEYLLTGELKPTNEWYAIAKIAGIKMCQAYRRQYGFDTISLMPTNLYGPGDNFNLENSHVVPALMRKLHQAKLLASPGVEIWSTGNPKREFLHVDDLADAALFLMENYSDERIVNVGVGKDVSIRELAELMAEIVGFKGNLLFNASMPDGTPRKLLDVTRINNLGWNAGISLRDGLSDTYRWFVEHQAGVKS